MARDRRATISRTAAALAFAVFIAASASPARGAESLVVDTPAEYAEKLTQILNSGDKRMFAEFVLANEAFSRKAIKEYREQAERSDPETKESLLILANYVESILTSAEAAVVTGAYPTDCGVTYSQAAEAYAGADYASALVLYQAAFHCYGAQPGDESGMKSVGCLVDMGNVHNALGDYKNALGAYTRALDIVLKLKGAKSAQAAALYNNIGLVQAGLGDYTAALESLSDALDTNIKLHGGEHSDIASNHNNLGMVHEAMGDRENALENYEKALEIRAKTEENSAGAAAGYNNIGNLHAAMGDDEDALENYEKALEISVAALGERHPDTALCHNNIGAVYFSRGDYEDALENYRKALAVFTSAYGAPHPRAAVGYNNTGGVYYEMEEYENALKYFESAAAALCDDPEEPETCRPDTNTVETFWNLARASAAEGAAEDAVWYYEAAADTLDRLRGAVESEESKKLHGGRYHEMFPEGVGAYAALAEETGGESAIEDALAFAERGTARVFLEMIGRSRAVVDGGLPEAVIREGLQLRAKWRAARESVRGEEDTAIRRKGAAARLASFDTLRMAEDAIKRYEEKLLRDYPDYAELMNPRQRPLKDIRARALAPGEAALEFQLGADASWLIFITDDDLKIAELPPAAEIEKKVDAFRRKLTNPEMYPASKLRADAEALYEMLLGPVDDEISDVDKLLIVPTGKLYFLPFEALVTDFGDGPGWLAEGFDIRYAPSLNVLYMVADRNEKSGGGREDWTDWLGFGDPVYDPGDYRAKGRSYKRETESMLASYARAMSLDVENVWKSIPGTGEEVAEIALLFGMSEEDDTVNLGLYASEERFTELAAEGSRYIHVASHGTLGEGGANQPAIVLTLVDDGESSGDGFLTMTEVLNTKTPTDMLTLSACKTGQGNMEKGEGVAGLSRAFMYSGADSVVVSLWSVADVETKDLMVNFYKKMRSGMGGNEALRAAKLDMIEEDMHPYFWAPFIFIGVE